MSDGHEADDSGSEYSTDDERRDEGAARSAERGGYNGSFSRLHTRSSSYSAGEKKEQGASLSALKSHHAFLHASPGHPASITPPDSEHSPLHLSPASLSPPLNPMLHPPGMASLSPLTVSAAATSSLNSFFPLSPHSASSALAQAVQLLPPDHFYLLPPLPSAATPSAPAAALTTANPFTLPSLYADALAERSHRAIHARQLIDAAALSVEEARVLRAQLTSGFEQWMRERFSVAGIRQLAGEEGAAGVGGVVQAMVNEARVGPATAQAAAE